MDKLNKLNQAMMTDLDLEKESDAIIDFFNKAKVARERSARLVDGAKNIYEARRFQTQCLF